MIYLRLVAIISMLFSLASCETLMDNPRQGGLFGGIYGLSSGAYNRRIEDRERQLSELRSRELEQRNEQARLKSESSMARQEISSLRREAAKLERRINSVRAATALSASSIEIKHNLTGRLNEIRDSLNFLDRELVSLTKEKRIRDELVQQLLELEIALVKVTNTEMELINEHLPPKPVPEASTPDRSNTKPTSHNR